MNAVQKCARHFAETHPNDVARLLELSPAEDGAPFLGGLSARSATRLLSHMSVTSGAEHLSLMDVEVASALSNQLPADSAIALLRRLKPEKRVSILTAMPQESRLRLERLLEYPDGTVGALVDTEVLTIPDNFTLEEAQRLFRKRAGGFHHQLYVVDEGRKLLGFVHVRDLLRASGRDPVTAIMISDPVCLVAGTRLANVLHHQAWVRLDALPVVDETGVLLGIVRHRQLRRFQTLHHPGGVAETIIGLSELYWIGLASFLRGGVAKVGKLPVSPAQAAGGSHVV